MAHPPHKTKRLTCEFGATSRLAKSAIKAD